MKRPEFKNTGVQAHTLIGLVENTAPFLFTESHRSRYVQILKDAKDALSSQIDRDLWGYYELCIASHFATVGTFVPTDVDNAIRHKLWLSAHSPTTFEPMWDLVKEFLTWDERAVSKRIAWVTEGSLAGKKLSGHQGEWFSIAMGAYGCALKIAPEFVPEIRNAIEAVVNDQEAVLLELAKQFDESPNALRMKTLLNGVAAVAHNLGDLDRMVDTWELSETDALKRRHYRLGHEDARHPRPLLFKSGQFYQKFLASENHRHFALREPKMLRKSSKFLLHYGPFLDEWGADLVKEGVNGGLLNEGEFREIVDALIHGWKRLNLKSIYHCQGYARALAGIQNALPRGRADLENLLPPLLVKEVTQGGLRTHLSVSKKQFEEEWVKKTRRAVAEWLE